MSYTIIDYFISWCLYFILTKVNFIILCLKSNDCSSQLCATLILHIIKKNLSEEAGKGVYELTEHHFQEATARRYLNIEHTL